MRNNITGTTLYKNITVNLRQIWQDIATASATGEKSVGTVYVP